MEERWLGEFVHCEFCSQTRRAERMRRTLGLALAAAIALAIVGGAATMFWNPQHTKTAFDPVMP